MIDKTKLVKFHTTKSEIEAELIKNELTRKKIPCSVLNVNNSRLLPEIPPEICGIEIWIPEAYIVKAKSIVSKLGTRYI